MTPQQAIDFYGSQAELARAVGIAQPSVWEWVNSGRIPQLRQCQLELLTKGNLKADQRVNLKSAVPA